MAPWRARQGPVCEQSVFKAAEWACEAVEGSNRAHLRLPGAGHDRQSGRDLTLGSVRGYVSCAWKVKKEIPVNL
jgi:hypothetical protein